MEGMDPSLRMIGPAHRGERDEIADDRDSAAEVRDRLARERDAAAEARDANAERQDRLDREAETRHRETMQERQRFSIADPHDGPAAGRVDLPYGPDGAAARRATDLGRRQAREDRTAAEQDRARAAEDRRAAHADRQQNEIEDAQMPAPGAEGGTALPEGPSR